MENYKITQNDQLDKSKMLNIFINEFKMKYNSIISNLFYGILEYRNQCQKCKKIKFNFQYYIVLVMEKGKIIILIIKIQM